MVPARAVRAAAVLPGQLALFPVDAQAKVIDLDARRQRTTDLLRWLESWTTPPVPAQPRVEFMTVEDLLGIQVLVNACAVAMVGLAPGKPPLIVIGPPSSGCSMIASRTSRSISASARHTEP